MPRANHISTHGWKTIAARMRPAAALAALALLPAALVSGCGSDDAASGDTSAGADKNGAVAAGQALQQWLNAIAKGDAANGCALATDELRTVLGNDNPDPASCESEFPSEGDAWVGSLQPDVEAAITEELVPVTISTGGSSGLVLLVDQDAERVAGFVSSDLASSLNSGDDVSAAVDTLASDSRQPVAIVGELMRGAAASDAAVICGRLAEAQAPAMMNALGTVQPNNGNDGPEVRAAFSDGCESTVALANKLVADDGSDANGLLSTPPAVIAVDQAAPSVLIPVDEPAADAEAAARSGFWLVYRGGSWKVLGQTVLPM